jgi:hypothetical protein
VERANPGGDPRRHLGSGFEDEAERGVLSADDYWRGFGERMHYPLSAAQWVEARQAAMEPDGALLALVRLLRVARPVGMFTNNPWLLQRHIGEVFPAVLELFGTHAVFSAELGRSKPDPEAFRHLATRLLGYPTSPDTLLRHQRQETFWFPTPRVLGVDGFALRRGATYGTLLVDLERRQPVAVLEEHTAKPLVKWLQAYPSMATLARDRADAYSCVIQEPLTLRAGPYRPYSTEAAIGPNKPS